MISRPIKLLFQKHPVLANCFSYGCTCIAAEFSQQFVNKRILKPKSTQPENYDFDSLKRYAVIGFVINPNILYFWYKWLDKTFVGVTKKIIFQKVMIDQFVMTPPLYVIFYTSMSIMEGKKNIFAELKSKFIPTFQTSCLFWLPAQTVNFLWIPSTYRVTYVGVCAFAWLNILCWIKNKNIEK